MIYFLFIASLFINDAFVNKLKPKRVTNPFNLNALDPVADEVIGFDSSFIPTFSD